ncbi:hypothetical protein SAMN04488065_2778 [Haloplanus vescus]|uniref:Uncharacterized protein n=1 Tax=Haloplanus vescus TaxID=555874 RepID=A0A1H4AHA7_9EURY|nr:hypothetical protein [Haloplanus vescus]SEA35267.1 hypothetical protein SAMN04488065_2778 [Haloplanus vescus]
MTDTAPLSGTTLVVGPSNAGKTRLTARTLTRWLEREGHEGVVVFDFAPEVERDGQILGGRLDRFVTLPDDVWRGVLDAHAPRTTGDTDDEAVELAVDNARRAADLFDAAPADPRAVFVNDATIPFQHPDADPSRLRDYCSGAEVVVLNALEADAIVGSDPVSEAERATLDAFRSWADRVVELDGA